MALKTSNSGQGKSGEIQNYLPGNIEVSLYQHGSDWKKKYPKFIYAETHSTGLNFYQIQSFDAPTLPSISITTGGIKTTIPKALNITATEDKERNLGIISIDINARVKSGRTISHEDARLYTLDFIEKITASGWKKTFSLSKPRLNGIHALNYYGSKSIDPNYKLSFTEWMKLEGTLSWHFYSNHTYMTLSVDRDQEHLDPNKNGAYIMSISILPQEEQLRRYVDEKQRDNWRQQWIPIAQKMRASRNIAEAKLQAQGIPIATEYKDPELPPPPAGQENPHLPKNLKYAYDQQGASFDAPAVRDLHGNTHTLREWLKAEGKDFLKNNAVPANLRKQLL
jgi:hypothetical protein